MSIFHRYPRFISICLLVIGIGGCATTTTMQQSQVAVEKQIKVLLLQTPMKIDPSRLQKVMAPNIKSPLSISDETIAQGMKHAQEYVSEEMKAALTKQPKIVVLTPTADEQRYLDKIRSKPLDTSLSQMEADSIRTMTGADVLMRYQITDYGLTPQSWRNGYITFEVTTTLALAAVIAYSGSTVAKAAAGAYLVQEGIEETAEAYAGFWALDVACRPVRIQAQLVRLEPVTKLWNASDTGFSNVKLLRLIRKVGSSERDKQLNQATDSAITDIVADLSDSLDDIKPVRKIR
jgi:hypothetical protein